jgi:hypothetical protein
MWRGEIKHSNIWGAASHTLKSMEENYIIFNFLSRIILPVVLYECETWSLTLKEEHRLKVFENRVLRKMSGPKRNEVT